MTGLAVRFIPACVGNSSAEQSMMMGFTVHPRVCGELGSSDGVLDSASGSSPRVWGTLRIYSEDPILDRFIPACVGNSHYMVYGWDPFSVHPRVCGELPSVTCTDIRQCGSSPRVWGTQGNLRSNAPTVRFIPACVGNSNFRMIENHIISVHPRVCGELIHRM